MRTLILRIDDLSETDTGRGYPITLSFDDGQPGWDQEVIAAALIPEELSPPAPPANAGGQPMSEADIRALILERANSPLFEKLGRYLHDLVVREQVKTEWERLRALHPGEQPPQEGIRAVLDIRAPKLRRLPWELLTREEVRLSTQLGNCFVRGSGIDFCVRNDGQLVPLRLLVVVGCPPQDDKVHAMDEVDAIRSTFPKFQGMIDHELLRGPSRSQLVETFQTFRPHILHFIGHGEARDDDAVLKLCDQGSQEWSLSRSDIVNDLAGWTGRLVVLNACRTSDPGEQAAVLSLAESFTQLGWPAVIGMQGDILASAAVAFAESLYSSLAEKKALDLALVDARRSVYMRENGAHPDQRDWFLPSVTLTVPPDQVLCLRFGAPDRVTEVDSARDFTVVRTFVDRNKQRRRIARGLDPDDPSVNPVNLMLVTGEEAIGKSWLVRWCLRMCALRGHSVRYVSLEGRSANFLEVLRRVRDTSTFACRAGATGAFASFNDDLNRWLRPVNDTTLVVPGQDAGFPVAGGRMENLIESIFGSFRAALGTAAGTSPLVIALDQLDSVLAEDFLNYVWPHLIQHVAQGGIDHVRMIVVMRPHEMSKLWPQDLLHAYERVDVARIGREEFRSLASEYLLHQGLSSESFHDLVVGMEKTMRASSWSPAVLKDLSSIVRHSGLVGA